MSVCYVTRKLVPLGTNYGLLPLGTNTSAPRARLVKIDYILFSSPRSLYDRAPSVDPPNFIHNPSRLQAAAFKTLVAILQTTWN